MVRERYGAMYDVSGRTSSRNSGATGIFRASSHVEMREALLSSNNGGHQPIAETERGLKADTVNPQGLKTRPFVFGNWKVDAANRRTENRTKKRALESGAA